jgi:hypothetical protein
MARLEAMQVSNSGDKGASLDWWGGEDWPPEISPQPQDAAERVFFFDHAH